MNAARFYPYMIALLISTAEPCSNPTPKARYRLNFVETGSGEPLILLHGLGGNWQRWQEVMPLLAENFRVFAIDQLGFGESDRPAINYGDRVLAQSLDGFMIEHSIPSAIIVGNSMGAGVAFAFAIDHPNKVNELVIVGGSPTRCTELRSPDDPWVLDQATLATPEKIVAGFSELYFDQNKFTKFVQDQVVATRLESQIASLSMVQSFVTGVGCVTNEELAQIQAPTLLVWGDKESSVSIQNAKRLQSELPHAELRFVADTSHLPHMEQPLAFVRALTPLLPDHRK